MSALATANTLTLLLTLASGLKAAESTTPAPKLTGVVRTKGKAVALLEFAPTRGLTQPVTEIFRAGESIEQIEVLRIDPVKPAVILRDLAAGTTNILTLTPSSDIPERALLLAKAGLKSALAIYQDLSGRTVIRESALPDARISVETEANLTLDEARQALERALSAAGVSIVASGDKFAYAVRPATVTRLASFPAPPPTAAGDEEIVFKPGMLRLIEADLGQVLDIFQELSGRTILRDDRLPAIKLTLGSQTALSRRESEWLLAALLQLGGIDCVPEGPKFAFVIPPSHPLRSKLPTFDENTAGAKAAKSASVGTLRLNSATTVQFLDMYSGLTGRQSVTPAADTSTMRFTLRSQGKLSPAEAIFAMESLAMLNNLRFELVGENLARIVPATQAIRPFERPTQ